MARCACALVLLAATMAAQQPDFEYLYRQALEQREQTLGKDALKTRESARDLGLYLARMGEYARAEAYRDAAVELAETPAEATLLHNWAVALEERDPALAEKIYRKVLLIRTKTLPLQDVELATTRLNLAALLIARGDAEAGKLAAAALGAFERKLPPMDARTGAACGVLGASLASAGDIAGAERQFRRALTISEKANGPGSSQTASALENLADLLSQTGRASAAGPLLQRAKRIRAGAR